MGGGGFPPPVWSRCPGMPLEELDPYRHPRFCPSPTTLIRTVHWLLRGWKSHLIGLWLSTGGRVTPMTPPFLRLPVLHLLMDLQQYQFHILPTLWTLHPNSLPLPVWYSCASHLLLVRCLWLGDYCLTEVADHSDRLPDILPQAHPI